MVSNKSKLWADFGWGYGLSGERRAAAHRNWRRHIRVNLVMLPIVIITVAIGAMFNIDGPVLVTYFVLGMIVTLAVNLYSVRRGDAAWQLWSKERSAISEARQKNLEDLMQHAKQVETQQRDSASER